MRKGATKRAMFVDTGNTGRGERVRWDSKMRFGVLGLLVIASMAATPVLLFPREGSPIKVIL